jgi:hypothetical protein
MNHFYKPTAFLVVLVSAVYCGKAQLNGGSSSTKVSPASTTVKDSTQGATLQISRGAAAGTTVSFVPGSLEIDTSVLAEVVEQPTNFSVGGVAKSSPAISVSASKSGESILTLSSPLSISVPVDTLALDSFNLILRSNDNLCMFLQSGSDLFVWRKSAITLTTAEGKSLAKVSSKRLGTFQLVYCGTEALPGFKDASEEKLGADNAHTLTFNSALYGLSQEKLCAGVVSFAKENDSKDSDLYSLGGKSTAMTGGGNISLSITLDTTKLVTGGEAAVVFMLLGASETCVFEKAGLIPSGSIVHKGLYAWGVSYTDVSKNLSGAFGDSRYPLSALKGSIAEAAESQSLPPGKHCLTFDSDSNNLLAHAEFEISTDNTGNLSSSYSFFLPASSSYRASLEIGSTCGQDNSTSPTASRYRISFPTLTTPNVQIASMAVTAAVASTYCVNIYDSSAFTNNAPASVTASPLVSWQNITLNSTAKSLIIPYLSLTDISVQFGCTSPATYLNDRPYNPNFSF